MWAIVEGPISLFYLERFEYWQDGIWGLWELHPTYCYPHKCGRLMFLPWSFLISVYDKLLNSNCKRKSFTFYIISVSKGRFIEQVLTDIWIDFMFIVTLKYPVSITSLNRKQPHVLSFGSCIVGGRTTRHDMKAGLTCMRESHVIQCPPFF